MEIRAHSEFTVVDFERFLIAVLAAYYGEIFNLRATGGYL